MIVLVCAVAMFASGALLFLVQPMIAKMVLPLLGGSPAVWNTAMLFYQVLLLAGYLYAHASHRWLSLRQQVWLHLLVIALPLAVLPMTLPVGWIPPADRNPIPWLLALLLVGAGLPFFAVSTTSPLLQSWFARSAHPRAANPYPLYAASNTGSMLALLGYPLLIEPQLALRDQSRYWAVGYGSFAVLILAAVAMLWRSSRSLSRTAEANASPMSPAVQPVTIRRRLRWIFLAFVPSSMMLSVTMYMSTNIAPFPLLWVLPLALYLCTFIVAFGASRVIPLTALRRATPLVLLPVAVVILSEATQPIRPLILFHLLAFTFVALVCHTELAVDAPDSASVTEFYLWLSIGGALGGVANALLAPLLFNSVLEYPLVLVVAALLIPAYRAADAPAETDALPSTPRALAMDLSLPIGLSAAALLIDIGVRQLNLGSEFGARVVTLGLAAVLCFPFAERPLRFGLGIAAMLLASTSFEKDRRLLFAERSFFGISRVFVTGGGGFHELAHGNISHGAQNLDPAHRRDPLTYYTRTGPAGQLILARQRIGVVKRVAVIGLGAGSLACYRREGEIWTFYEIDPLVLRIARDARYFSYLRDCAPEAQVTLGDARISLASAADRMYDLMLLDAYSADAIPVHLMTREAIALYRRKLAPSGIIALHVSNRYFDLESVVAALAQDAGLVTLIRRDVGLSKEESRLGKTESVWMLLAEPATALDEIARDARWRRAAVAPGMKVWTDDFSSTLSALR
jgi:hypothetical protein